MSSVIDQVEQFVKRFTLEVTLRDRKGDKVIDAELTLPRDSGGHHPDVVIWRDRLYKLSHHEADRAIYYPAQVSQISWYLDRGKFRG